MKSNLPVLKTKRLVLKHIALSNATHHTEFAIRNQNHFQWVSPAPQIGKYTESFWEKKMANGVQDFENDRAVFFVMYEKSNEAAMVGTIDFTQIARGPLQACYLGYSLDHAQEGKGFMTEGLTEAIRYMFEEKNIHRVMASYVPENTKSGAVLKRLGFTFEGLAKGYLRINNEWRDHVLTSLMNPTWKSS